MTRHYELMVENAPAPVGKVTVVAPWDGSEIATVDTGDERHVDAALTAAQR